MDWQLVHQILYIIQHTISFIGVLIILSGVILALCQYIRYFFTQSVGINTIRLDLGRVLILGLEFIVAADLIGTTTTPDYYALGIVACIVAIRTLLSYSLNKEMQALTKEPN